VSRVEEVVELSEANKALVERFYKDGEPESASTLGSVFSRLNTMLDAARDEGQQ